MKEVGSWEKLHLLIFFRNFPIFTDFSEIIKRNQFCEPLHCQNRIANLMGRSTSSVHRFMIFAAKHTILYELRFARFSLGSQIIFYATVEPLRI